MRNRSALTVSICLLAWLAVVPMAGATFPGTNGAIHFVSYDEPYGQLAKVFANGDGRELLAGPIEGLDPAPSPDGTRVAFAQAGDIWLADTDGSNPAPVTTSPANEYQPAWTPNGEHIVFVSLDQTGFTSIELIATDGSGRELLHLSGTHASDPAVSPDGTRVAFTRAEPGLTSRRVHSIPITGSISSGTPILPPGSDDPDWDPSGNRLAYSMPDSSGNSRIFVSEPGGPPIPVGAGGGFRGREPSFSPSGRTIVFTATGPGGLPQLALALRGQNGDWDDESMSFVTSGGGYGSRSPAWSSAGSPPGPPPTKSLHDGRIFLGASGSDSDGDIYSMTPAGARVKRLTTNPGMDRDPDVSLPGSHAPQRVAFTSHRDGRTGIWTMKPDGTNQRLFAPARTRHAADPSWSPFGSSLAYAGRTAGMNQTRIFVATTGGVNRQVTFPQVGPRQSARDYEPVYSPDGTRIAFRRSVSDDVTVVVRQLCTVDVTTGDERCSVSGPEARESANVERCDRWPSDSREVCRWLAEGVTLAVSRGTPSWIGDDSIWSTAGVGRAGSNAYLGASLPYGLYEDDSALSRSVFAARARRPTGHEAGPGPGADPWGDHPAGCDTVSFGFEGSRLPAPGNGSRLPGSGDLTDLSEGPVEQPAPRDHCQPSGRIDARDSRDGSSRSCRLAGSAYAPRGWLQRRFRRSRQRLDRQGQDDPGQDQPHDRQFRGIPSDRIGWGPIR